MRKLHFIRVFLNNQISAHFSIASNSPSWFFFCLWFCPFQVGLVIGKGGEAIKSMQAKSEARIQVYYLVLLHYLQSEIRFHWIYLLVVFSCFTQGLFGRKNCSKQAQVLGCSVCNGGHELQFRSFILAKYVTCVGHLDAYSEMIYCSRYGRFSRITSVSLKPY